MMFIISSVNNLITMEETNTTVETQAALVTEPLLLLTTYNGRVVIKE
jgi:hypothetical protein